MRLIIVNRDRAYEVSHENAGIRVAPHFYTTDDEVRQAMDTIDDILADGSWKSHDQNRDFVT